MCYAKLKLIVEKMPAEICINRFCKTRNICATFKKLQTMFLGPGFTQHCAGQLKEELRNLMYKGKHKYNRPCFLALGLASIVLANSKKS